MKTTNLKITRIPHLLSISSFLINLRSVCSLNTFRVSVLRLRVLNPSGPEHKHVLWKSWGGIQIQSFLGK